MSQRNRQYPLFQRRHYIYALNELISYNKNTLINKWEIFCFLYLMFEKDNPNFNYAKFEDFYKEHRTE